MKVGLRCGGVGWGVFESVALVPSLISLGYGSLLNVSSLRLRDTREMRREVGPYVVQILGSNLNAPETERNLALATCMAGDFSSGFLRQFLRQKTPHEFAAYWKKFYKTTNGGRDGSGAYRTLRELAELVDQARDVVNGLSTDELLSWFWSCPARS